MHPDAYDFRAIEPKWQRTWEERGSFRADASRLGPGRPKFYCLVMFPYPSGKIHMGHARNYCIGDVLARYKRMKGFEVLHPLGWDAFGLPAENAAIQNKVDPAQWTRQNIRDMRSDIQLLGISYDWEREFATCDEDYYRWNQWFFIQMFKRGLAYRRKSAVNWCPQCQTVLANEQVHDGRCWRCHSEVAQKDLDQWFFKVTDYAERLLEDLKLLEGKWPDEVIAMQRNWIGRSTGALVDFPVKGSAGTTLTVFTTRPDTLYGSTFLVVSPEHPLTPKLFSAEEESKAQGYIAQARKKPRSERLALDREKTGVFSGSFAVNPVNGKEIPIWIADYVLADYGTGAIMAVPAHDQRDYEFAKKFGLPIVEVIRPEKSGESDLSKRAYEGEGVLVHSGEFDGTSSLQAIEKISEKLEKAGSGKESVTYRIRDWLLSRQRYWGTPIPMVYCAACGIVPVKESDLPVVLPKNVRFTGQGESPLAQVAEFVNTACPRCSGPARRETDTMDTFVDSSWYYLRYTDPKNDRAAFGTDRAERWVPVDQYIGGIEHACMHLVYSRFFHKVIHDLGMVRSSEPFANLLTQGMVTLGGAAMSKSKGNAVPVEEMAKEYGADTARLFVLFASPPRNQLEWSEEGVQGMWRFLNRIWRLSKNLSDKKGAASAAEAASQQLLRKTHQTIKKVEEDIEKGFQFNTAIAAMMELLNALSDYPAPGDAASQEAFRNLLVLLFPFAPHAASELWELGAFQPADLDAVPYPRYDPERIVEAQVEVVIQVNGKLKGKVTLTRAEAQDEPRVVERARRLLAEKGLKSFADGAGKHRFVPGRLVNFITDPTQSEVAK